MIIREAVSSFFKGVCMGVVNVLPISSGTISLVLGIFERFINAIKALNVKNFKRLFRGDAVGFLKHTDFGFLSVVLLGVVAGMLATSLFLKSSMKAYEIYTWSFFIGLIIASVVYVLRSMDRFNLKLLGILVVGLLISFFLSIKSNPYSNDNFFYLMLCGLIGATGMVVPGISGSHLMIVMGNYELIVTGAIPNMARASTFMDGFMVLFPFALGCVISLVLFSHLLSWLMRDFRNQTLSVLAGFMLGSLPVVYPWKEPSADKLDYVFHLPPANSETLLAIFMALLGAGMVLLVEVIGRHKAKKASLEGKSN